MLTPYRTVHYPQRRLLGPDVVQEEEEEEFYILPSYDKNGHVVVRETLLVTQLNHRVHQSLSDSSLVFSDCKALWRTTTRVHDSVCVRLGLHCLLKSETAVKSPSIRLVTGAAAKFCRYKVIVSACAHH